MLEKQISLKPVCVYYTGMTVFKVECAAAGNPSIFVQAFLFSFWIINTVLSKGIYPLFWFLFFVLFFL